MMALARHIPQANATLRQGDWRRSDFVGTELCGKTLGVVGLGNIGSIVSDRARGLKMKIVAYDPFLTQEGATRLGVELATLAEVYARADFLTVHTPLTDDTRGMVGDDAFAAMRDGVRIVNCARGGIVDEEALLRALEEDVILTITASEGDEEAFESRERQLGRFTARLVEGLAGQADLPAYGGNGDGLVSLNETAQYVEATVPQDAAAAGQSHPDKRIVL